MVDTFSLQPGYKISRVIKGNWQLSEGHNQSSKANTVDDLMTYAENGIITFDCADIYTGVEELIGKFLKEYKNKYGADDAEKIKIHTKFVPDLTILAEIDKNYIDQIITRSLQRMGREKIDLVQFHWWDYSISKYVEAANFLKELQTDGKIDLIGTTNFDVDHLEEIINSGVKIVSNQVQYSVLDNRPELRMVDFCKTNDIKLLCYGALAGGFLSEKYLNQPEPIDPLENRSLIKYKLIIEDWGGWNKFQMLLKCLHEIAKKHNVTISNVAIKYILQKDQVAACIVGSRDRSHLENTLKIFSFELTDDEIKSISEFSKNSLLSGDIYGLERIKGGKHAGIMKYNLNKN